MSGLFPYANILAGLLVLLVGFGFHWLGQLVSVINWKLAPRLGLREKDLLPEYLGFVQGSTAPSWMDRRGFGTMRSSSYSSVAPKPVHLGQDP